jgi:hypothetical protein
MEVHFAQSRILHNSIAVINCLWQKWSIPFHQFGRIDVSPWRIQVSLKELPLGQLLFLQLWIDQDSDIRDWFRTRWPADHRIWDQSRGVKHSSEMDGRKTDIWSPSRHFLHRINIEGLFVFDRTQFHKHSSAMQTHSRKTQMPRIKDNCYRNIRIFPMLIRWRKWSARRRSSCSSHCHTDLLLPERWS